MRREIALTLGVVACAAVLSACTEARPAGSGAGPTATSTAAPAQAAALAGRYHAAGGDADVYGIQTESAREGSTPLIILRTRNADSDHALFKEQAASVTSFLTGEEGLSLGGGYLMDVYGPDGRLLHRWDTTGG